MKCLLSPATLHFTHHKGGMFTSTHFSRYLWLSTRSSTHSNLTDIVSTITEKGELWVKCSKYFALCTTFFFLNIAAIARLQLKIFYHPCTIMRFIYMVCFLGVQFSCFHLSKQLGVPSTCSLCPSPGSSFSLPVFRKS